jgi:diadenosine tetraphosphatase ApaH/serine/threonine PP2A family protein phosphatase
MFRRAPLHRCSAAAADLRNDMMRAILSGSRDAVYPATKTIKLLEAARAVALKQPNVARTPSAPAPFTTVCGDMHGQGRDFLSIFERFGAPSAERPYLFNGDLVDRGPNGVEISLILASLTVDRPGSIFVNRGHREHPEVFAHFGFAIRELPAKYREDVQPVSNAFSSWFHALPIAHIVDNRVFVVHGGLPAKRNITVDEINALDRHSVVSHRFIERMLWSDYPGVDGDRARFTAADTATFLKAVKCDFLLRSHECKDQGFELHHNKTARRLGPQLLRSDGQQGCSCTREARRERPAGVLAVCRRHRGPETHHTVGQYAVV